MSMQPPNATDLARAKELMSAAMLGTLADAERAELLSLQNKLAATGVSIASLAEDAELAVGEAIAAMGARSEAMPAALRDKIEAMGRGLVAGGNAGIAGRVAPPSVSTSGGLGGGLGGWIVAACAVIVATVGWMRPARVITSEPAPVLSASQQRAELLSNSDSQVLSWSTGPDPAGKEIKGDIVWNTRLQKGYLRFRGAAKNDPTREQYQLWIFDKARQEFAVDGGVFNVADNSVDSGTGDIIIPVDAKLRVFDPALFAVTLERPDGVVVTDKGRIVATASPEAPKGAEPEKKQ
jgi:hypothetical protein